MSKYDPITRHLSAQQTPRLRLSFSDIERILGFKLPQSARKYPAWWANDATPGRQSASWPSASWMAEEVDIPGEKVGFRRLD